MQYQMPFLWALWRALWYLSGGLYDISLEGSMISLWRALWYLSGGLYDMSLEGSMISLWRALWYVYGGLYDMSLEGSMISLWRALWYLQSTIPVIRARRRRRSKSPPPRLVLCFWMGYSPATRQMRDRTRTRFLRRILDCISVDFLSPHDSVGLRNQHKT